MDKSGIGPRISRHAMALYIAGNGYIHAAWWRELRACYGKLFTGVRLFGLIGMRGW